MLSEFLEFHRKTNYSTDLLKNMSSAVELGIINLNSSMVLRFMEVLVELKYLTHTNENSQQNSKIHVNQLVLGVSACNVCPRLIDLLRGSRRMNDDTISIQMCLVEGWGWGVGRCRALRDWKRKCFADSCVQINPQAD